MIRLVAFVAISALTVVAWAYEIETHADMSTNAARTSVLADLQFLRTLGLKYPIEAEQQKFPSPQNTYETILNLVRQGARFEDSAPRPLNHFYDPLYDRPLGIGERSPDWALEDRRSITGQAYSHRDAREYMYRALSMITEAERHRHFGLLFQTLGQVIHHVQDMAQPQHVRNDAHCDRWYCLGTAHDPSLYEKYTDQNRNKPFFTVPLATAYRPVSFDSPRSFWTTTDGRGMADFTNRNFLSKDTNFNYLDSGQVTRNQRYPLPVWDGTTESVPIQTLLAQDGTCPPGTPPSQPPCHLVGDVVFHSTTVSDVYAGGGAVPNPRATTLSLFDQDLQTYNARPVYTDPDDPFSVSYEYERVFTLNRFNFQAAYPHLIPKAVAYSAGLIDFFFRGRIDVLDISDDDSQLYIEIKNVSGTGNGFTRGRFELYYDATDGTRRPLTISQNATADLAVSGRIGLVATKPRLSEVDLSKESPLVLVYRGRIGEEEGIAAAVLEMPLSGFIVEPRNATQDGIAGPRLIYFEDGQWRLSPYAGLVAGRIDWKGWYRNGRATKVLTWNGGGTGLDEHIFYNGRLLAVAPIPVLGAALTRDADGNAHVVTIGYNFVTNSNEVYVRPAKRSSSPAMRHPVTAPDGWVRTAQYVLETDARQNALWFFNGPGTEAQTMLEAPKTVTNVGPDGAAREQRITGLDRLKYIGTTVGGQITNLGNLSGFVQEIQSQRSLVQGGNGCGDPALAGETVSVNESGGGEYIVGVDYLDTVELLVKRVQAFNSTVTSTGVYTYQAVTDPQTGDCGSYPSSTVSTSASRNPTDRLTIEGQTWDIQVRAASSTDNCSTTSSQTSGSHDFSGLATSSEIVSIVYFIDPRHRLFGFREHETTSSINYSATGSFGSSTNPLQTITTSNQTTTVKRKVALAALTQPLSFGEETTTLGGTHIGPSRGCGLPSGGSTTTRTLSLAYMRSFLYDPEASVRGGSLLVDTAERLIVSQDQGNRVLGSNRTSLGNYNYLVGGDLTTVVPQYASGVPGYYPIGLVR